MLAALAGRIFTIEIVPELAQSAAALLKRIRFRNVTVSCGYHGWMEEAPFDRIILTAAPPDIPQVLVDQLKPGGRMVVPVGGSPFTQSLVVIKKFGSYQ